MPPDPTGLARIAFGLGVMGLGIVGLRLTAISPPPWPAWVPWRGSTAVRGPLPCWRSAGRACISRPRGRRRPGFCADICSLDGAQAAGADHGPLVEVSWLAVGEVAVLAAGRWALFAELARRARAPFSAFATGERGGAPLACSSLSRCRRSASPTSSTFARPRRWCPRGCPFASGWAYLTGAGHTRPGVGLLVSISPRRARAMRAAMLTIFTGLCGSPRGQLGEGLPRTTGASSCFSWRRRGGVGGDCEHHEPRARRYCSTHLRHPTPGSVDRADEETTRRPERSSAQEPRHSATCRAVDLSALRRFVARRRRPALREVRARGVDGVLEGGARSCASTLEYFDSVPRGGSSHSSRSSERNFRTAAGNVAAALPTGSRASRSCPRRCAR